MKAVLRKGFTLVELLVVIGIIALLIAILMPALSRARKQALQASCGSNARQITYGTLAYANDWREMLPTLNNPEGTRTQLDQFARLPIVGFDTDTVWDWGTFVWSPGDTRNWLGGLAFVMRDYLKNDWDVYTCPDGWNTKGAFIKKASGLAYATPSTLTLSGWDPVPYANVRSPGYLYLSHRPDSSAAPGGCLSYGQVFSDRSDQVARAASDRPDLLVLTDWNIFDRRTVLPGCGYALGGCGVAANHNPTSNKDELWTGSACLMRVFPPNIGRQENPNQVPLGMNRSRIDARTTWLAWQDWDYYRYLLWTDTWHSF